MKSASCITQVTDLYQTQTPGQKRALVVPDCSWTSHFMDLKRSHGCWHGMLSKKRFLDLGTAFKRECLYYSGKKMDTF